MASMRFTAGRMLCGKIRTFLDQCKFEGMDVDYLESSGWFERDFMIKGSDKDVTIVLHSLRDWVAENNLNT
jgi:hypothetical protein